MTISRSRITFDEDRNVLVDKLRVGFIQEWPKGWILVLTTHPLHRKFYGRLKDATKAARAILISRMTGVPDGRITS